MTRKSLREPLAVCRAHAFCVCEATWDELSREVTRRRVVDFDEILEGEESRLGRRPLRAARLLLFDDILVG